MTELNPYFSKLLLEMTPEQQQEIQGDPELFEALQNMDSESLDALLQDYEGKGEIIDSQMAMAENLRGREGAEGINAGGQYIAASPLSHIAKTGNNLIADYKQRKGIADMGGLSDQKSGSMRGLADILRGSGSQGIMSMFEG